MRNLNKSCGSMLFYLNSDQVKSEGVRKCRQNIERQNYTRLNNYVPESH